MRLTRWIVALNLLVPILARAADDVLPPVQFEREVLDNGLRVLYAPMRNAPVVHVQVLYHVGSKDEDPNRQGFAHMFEHMMFRGSANVASEQHMKLINGVGGNSNASTYVDWTRYVNTIPANHTEMALWLEADRMASFRVNEEVLQTELAVVAEEWRLRTANPPYGTFWQDFFDEAYKQHHYRWTTIGDMQQLAQSTPPELQKFFNTYYVPNNAVLVIAGDIDVEQTKQQVRKFYGWIPRGADIQRVSPPEPEQTELRRRVVYKENIPLARVMMGFRTTTYTDDDQWALDLLGTIFGGGRSSRIYQALVAGENALCNSASAGNQQFEDVGQFLFSLNLLPDKDPVAAQEVVMREIARMIESGPTEDELAKAKLSARLSLIRNRRTAQSVAGTLADMEVFGRDANLINTAPEKIAAVTAADIQRVAAKYLQPTRLTVLEYRPGKAPEASSALEIEAAIFVALIEDEKMPAPRVTDFPADYPRQPPINKEIIAANYDRGGEFDVNGIRVIVLRDDRLPVVSWNLTLRGGSHAEPAGKDGLANLTASMMTVGSADLTQEQFATDLANRGISISVSDGGDVTTVSGSSLVSQLDHAILRTRQVLLEPRFDAGEFERLKLQSMSGLMQSLVNGTTVAQRELSTQLFGESPLGRQTTLDSLRSISLDDVKQWYSTVYKPKDAILVFAGAIDTDTARAAAGRLLADFTEGAPPLATYDLPAPSGKRTIVLVDNPRAQQATIRVGVRAYDNKSDEKYAGAVATQVLSNGIDSRLNRYLRAEKGLTYGSYGRFVAGRQGGSFTVTIDTKSETTGEAVAGIFTVLKRMRDEDVTATEIAEAKQRIAGGMVMDTQTADQQASRRVDVILNEYPDDYYEQFPKRIGEVEASQVRELMEKYADDEKVTIIVVAPASAVKDQLAQFGEVKVIPMPVQRPRRE